MSHVFVTSCVQANGDDINEMMDSPLCQDLSAANFINRIATKQGIDRHIIEMLGYDSKRKFADDYALSCHKSFYQGVPCYLVQHSRIEYVYVDEKDRDDLLSSAEAGNRQNRISVLSNELDELFYDRKPSSQKAIYALVKEFYLDKREELVRNKIPLSSLAQHQCDYRKAVMQFDRSHYLCNGVDSPEPSF